MQRRIPEHRPWAAVALRCALLVACGLLPAACSSSGASAPHTPSASSGSPSDSGPSQGTSTGPSGEGTEPAGAPVQLPRGGTAIIGHYRVVADYGAAGNPQLGVLGEGDADEAARAVLPRAAKFDGLGLPVQPAMELLGTVAQGSPGPDGSYSAAVPMSTIRRYLAAAHKYRMLLILDLQPGEASFLSQAKHLSDVLLDPSVSLALDPEWKVGPGEAPGGGRIGSSSAAGVNAVTRWLSGFIAAHDLPDKLLVVHEFTSTMLPDRQNIYRRPGVEVSFHADGFGYPSTKKNVFHGLHFPAHPFGVGFKLFLTQDARVMKPKQVLRLHPQPDIITYQ